MVLALARRGAEIIRVSAKEILALRGIEATEPEAMVYLWLESRGYSEEEGTMNFQSGLWGGRQWYGGLVADFLLYAPSLLALWVQGDYWHRDPVIQEKDEFNKARMEAEGIPVVRIREAHIYAALDSVMEDALRGIEWEQG